jgi:6-phosphogluconolactonase
MKMHVAKTPDELSNDLANFIVDHIRDTLQHQQRYTIALSGGNSPKKLNSLLCSEEYKNKIDWEKLHIFWGDERYVPFADERNNAKMAFDTLLNFVPVPATQIHIMRTDIPPDISATAYEKVLHEYFDFTQIDGSLPHHAEQSAFPFQPMLSAREASTFDFVLLGMGDDAHTLSLFPGKSDVIQEKEKWCTSLWLESQSMYRITLTAPVVNQSACVAFLVPGNNKARALQQVLKGEYDPDKYPSQIIQPVNGELHFFVDEAAASLL